MDNSKGWDIEKTLEAAGSWDRFQKLVLFMSFVSAIPNTFVSFHFVFTQYEPHHHCTYPQQYVIQANQSVSKIFAYITVAWFGLSKLIILVTILVAKDVKEKAQRSNNA